MARTNKKHKTFAQRKPKMNSEINHAYRSELSQESPVNICSILMLP